MAVVGPASMTGLGRYVLSRAGQNTLAGMLCKSGGSLPRISDDWNAPAPVRNHTILREAFTLLTSTALNSQFQRVFSASILPRIKATVPRLAACDLLLRGIGTFGAIMGVELASRKIFPKMSWEQRLGNAQKPPMISDDTRRNGLVIDTFGFSAASRMKNATIKPGRTFEQTFADSGRHLFETTGFEDNRTEAHGTRP